MKLFVEIDDHKAASFIQLIKDLGYIKARPLLKREEKLLEEIKEKTEAVEDADKKPEKPNNKPADRLFNSPEVANYKQKLNSVSTWNEDDLRVFEEVKKDFRHWKSTQW